MRSEKPICAPPRLSDVSHPQRCLWNGSSVRRIDDDPQSISQSVSQSSVNQSVSQSVGRSVSQSVSQSVSRSVSQSVSRSVGRSVSQSVSQSVGQSVSQSVRALVRALRVPVACRVISFQNLAFDRHFRHQFLAQNLASETRPPRQSRHVIIIMKMVTAPVLWATMTEST